LEIPYVFEVPTTLESFHTLISTYATTGSDVTLIIQRIHKTNSVRLDRRNSEKMQKFYDVLLRRFVAVGDAIHTSGNGGPELDRYKQLDSLTQTLYAMAQEAPDIAGAVWNRRLGILQSAHAKRLRDASIDRVAADGGDEEVSAWPSTGVILLLRALGHVFPVTDQRHYVVTPTLLFLGQMLGHTPLVSMHDLVMGTLCCGLLVEYTKDAKRIAPEAHAFLSSVLRLFAHNALDRQGSYPLPTFQAASRLDSFSSVRTNMNGDKGWDDANPPQLSLESSMIRSHSMPVAILYAALHWIEVSIQNLSGSLSLAETEVFAEIAVSLSYLQSTKKKGSAQHPLPRVLKEKVLSVASLVTATVLEPSRARPPLQRRAAGPIAWTTLAPRLEDPERYTVSKTDRHKSATQAELDRTRREYKREHKAVSRELRLDNTMIEEERRRVQDKKDAAAKAKRQRAFAWLESEQASMNQQVRQGGGLLQGGGTGAAKAKAASAKLGIKKGGKLR
jgi:nucleolar protein 14